eukprot:scaffold216686_cov14-Prasinocladus_malaysianus.AAC.1
MQQYSLYICITELSANNYIQQRNKIHQQGGLLREDVNHEKYVVGRAQDACPRSRLSSRCNVKKQQKKAAKEAERKRRSNRSIKEAAKKNESVKKQQVRAGVNEVGDVSDGMAEIVGVDLAETAGRLRTLH